MNEISPTLAVESMTSALISPWESITIGKLAGALAKAQGKMRHAAKDSTNPHFKTKYADLASVIEAAREPLGENGLAVVQVLHHIGGPDSLLVTKLIHESGEWMASEYPIAITAQQQVNGSAITYARRYSYAAMLGIAADEDDDGNAAQGASTSRAASGQKAETKAATKKADTPPATAPANVDPLHPWRAYGAPEPGETQIAPAWNPPKVGDKTEWGVWGAWFKAQVQAAGNIAYIDAMLVNNLAVVDYIKKKYAPSWVSLQDAVDKRRGDLSQAPPPKAETKSEYAQDLDDEIPF